MNRVRRPAHIKARIRLVSCEQRRLENALAVSVRARSGGGCEVVPGTKIVFSTSKHRWKSLNVSSDVSSKDAILTRLIILISAICNDLMLRFLLRPAHILQAAPLLLTNRLMLRLELQVGKYPPLAHVSPLAVICVELKEAEKAERP